jgi:sialic acid synthase SpsE
MSVVKIDGRWVGPDQRALVIAEIGVNHDGSVERAIELVHHAASAGADAVKLQIFRARSLMHPTSQFARYQQSRVSDSDPAAMLERFELSEGGIGRVVDAIKELRMVPLATPFSPEDVLLIEQLGLPAIKIASPDLVNRLLLERAARLDLPLLLSTGAATMEEVEQTVGWLDEWDASAVLLHCVSSYPTPVDQAHLGWIGELARFGRPVGYSDHTTDMLAGALAVAAGACVIEKHLTYDRNATGPDHSSSADPLQFFQYIQHIRAAVVMRGSIGKHVLPIEQDVRSVSRQSLVLRRALQRGEVVTIDDLTVQRPGTGIAPADAPVASGRTARSALAKGTLLQWEMLADAA